jgi:hypothetical protein
METDQPPISSAQKTYRYIGLAILIFSLILILFLGTRGWFIGSARAECFLNIRNVQQAVRGHQGMNNEGTGSPINWNEFFGPGIYFASKPRCPAGGDYTFSKVHPEVGHLACTCSHAKHVPPNHHDW